MIYIIKNFILNNKKVFNMKKILSFFCMFLMITNFVFAKNPKQVEEINSFLSKVQKNYKSIKTINAKFFQTSRSEALGEEEKSKGEFKALIPNNIKVQYSSPRSQVYLITKEGLTFLNNEYKQVVRDSADSVLHSKIPLTFLAGLGDIQKDFLVKDFKEETTSYVLTFSPKNEGEMETLVLSVNKKTLLVDKIFVEELGGNTISFKLSNIVLNKNVKNSDFTVNIPEGYDLIDNK